MKLRIFLALTSVAVIPALTVPNLVEAQTRIGDLQRSSGTTLSGKVTSVVGNNFILDDGTGQIIVDAGPRWYREVKVSPGEQITVVGELGRGGELDAFSLTKPDDSVVEIRPEVGPPPWAGGPERSGRPERGPNRPESPQPVR